MKPSSLLIAAGLTATASYLCGEIFMDWYLSADANEVPTDVDENLGDAPTRHDSVAKVTSQSLTPGTALLLNVPNMSPLDMEPLPDFEPVHNTRTETQMVSAQVGSLPPIFPK